MAYLNSILKNQIKYVRDSGIHVDIDLNLDCVLIYDEEGCEIFLDGESGHEFIRQVDTFVGQYDDITYPEARALAAYPWADILPESPRL